MQELKFTLERTIYQLAALMNVGLTSSFVGVIGVHLFDKYSPLTGLCA